MNGTDEKLVYTFLVKDKSKTTYKRIKVAYRLHEECEIWERYPQPNYITNHARTTEGALHKYAVFWVE